VDLNTAIEAWKVGGIILLLLLFMGVGIIAVWRNEVNRYNALALRLSTVEGKFVDVLLQQIQLNTGEMAGLKAETKSQTAYLKQVFTAMHERPCLNSGHHQTIKTPLPIFPERPHGG
jgi:hypothetical protein